VEEDEPLDPRNVGLLGARAVAPSPERLPHAIEEAWSRRLG
jgi:hypothetical protein